MNALKLAIFGFLTSALVGLVYVWTAEPIAKAQQDARDATIRAMLSEVDEIGLGIETSLTDARLLEQLGWSTPIVIRALTRNDAVVGYLVPIRAPSGYSGPIDIISPEVTTLPLERGRPAPHVGAGPVIRIWVPAPVPTLSAHDGAHLCRGGRITNIDPRNAIVAAFRNVQDVLSVHVNSSD